MIHNIQRKITGKIYNFAKVAIKADRKGKFQRFKNFKTFKILQIL